MKRYEVLTKIFGRLEESDLFISTTGMISREAFGAKDRPGNFYMVGSMGLATPLALGIALNSPDKKVFAVEGDGSAFLNFGSLPMVASEKPANLFTIVIDNGCYESTGGQPCLSRTINIANVAHSLGYINSLTINNEQEWVEKANQFFSQSGPSLLLVKVDSTRQEGVPRVSHSPEEIKERFSKTVSAWSFPKEVLMPRQDPNYQMPVTVYFGRGIIKNISRFLGSINERKIFLICGQHFMNDVNYISLTKDILTVGARLTIAGGNVAISDFVTINRIVKQCREDKPDLIMAVGGGTIIDTAKCAAALATNGGSLEDYLINKEKSLENKGIPVVAVPTTAGTGSEVTPWATVWDTVGKKKYSLSSFLIFPHLAIVDSALTDSLSAKTTADTGIDALAQAIEAFWSKSHNHVSDKYALEAIRLIIENLTDAFSQPSAESRDKMAKAALYSGLAFSNTRTTICHSISYPLTNYFGMSHGQAVAITLPLFVKYSLPALGDDRKAELLAAIDANDETSAAEKIEKLMLIIGLATKLSQLGVGEGDIDLIVEEAYAPGRMDNAPIIPSQDELKQLLSSIV